MTNDQTSTEPVPPESPPPPPDKPAANMAAQIREAVTGTAELMETPLPDAGCMAPRVSLALTVTRMARELGMLLREEALFIRVTDKVLVTVDPETGDVNEMYPLRFVSWSEQRVVFFRPANDGEIVCSMSAEIAARVLASDVFRRCIRPLRSVHHVVLPVWANTERTALRRLPAGYDAGTATYTVDSVPYREDMPPDEAREFFLELFQEFPFARPDDKPEQPLAENRNFAVFLAGMFSLYCRALLSGSLRPALAIQAGQAGSGKTLLLRIMLNPVFGGVSIQSAPRDEAELSKTLTTNVLASYEYMVLDNLSGFYKSDELESFLTSPRRRGRVLGKSVSADAENLIFVFVTGNGLTISPDLARRFLLCDLWWPGDVLERNIARPIDDEWLSSTATRANFLAAMWSLVEVWSFKGCPRSKGAKLATFETYSGIVGGIITAALFADPIARPEVRLDEREQEFRALFRALAEPIPDGGSVAYEATAIIEKAEELGLAEVLPRSDSKSPSVSIGKKLKAYMGRQFTDGKGRLFEFGHRRKITAGARYTVTILTPKTDASAGGAASDESSNSDDDLLP